MTSLNSSFCAVTADSKSKWPHRKKKRISAVLPYPTPRRCFVAKHSVDCKMKFTSYLNTLLFPMFATLRGSVTEFCDQAPVGGAPRQILSVNETIPVHPCPVSMNYSYFQGTVHLWSFFYCRLTESTAKVAIPSSVILFGQRSMPIGGEWPIKCGMSK